MGCGCGKTGQAEMVRMEQSYSRPDGTFALYNYPDCDGGYHGPFEGESVFVVARLTEYERVFPRLALAEASDYMNSIEDRRMATIEKVAAVTLCSEAIEEAFSRAG